MAFPYGEAEKDRDLEHGYPSGPEHKADQDLTDTVGEWITGTGAFRN